MYNSTQRRKELLSELRKNVRQIFMECLEEANAENGHSVRMQSKKCAFPTQAFNCFWCFRWQIEQHRAIVDTLDIKKWIGQQSTHHSSIQPSTTAIGQFLVGLTNGALSNLQIKAPLYVNGMFAGFNLKVFDSMFKLTTLCLIFHHSKKLSLVGSWVNLQGKAINNKEYQAKTWKSTFC